MNCYISLNASSFKRLQNLIEIRDEQLSLKFIFTQFDLWFAKIIGKLTSKLTDRLNNRLVPSSLLEGLKLRFSQSDLLRGYLITEKN